MEEIKNAITVRLGTKVTDIAIYDEKVQQGFEEPAFFVLPVTGGQSRGLNRRRVRTTLFDIHYFPPLDVARREACERMAVQLYEWLEYVEDIEGNKYRGLDIRHEVVDEVLHFFVSFRVHLMKEKQPETKMQTIKQEVGLIWQQ